MRYFSRKLFFHAPPREIARDGIRKKSLSVNLICITTQIWGKYVWSKNAKQNTVRGGTISSPPPKPRKTTFASCSSRNIIPDELERFREADKLVVRDIIDKIKYEEDVVVFKQGPELVIQSKDYYSGRPNFVIKIKEDSQFETYHIGTLCSVTTSAKNKGTTCKYWSTFDEIIRYLKGCEITNKKKVFLEHAECMATVVVGKPIYAPEVITKAFDATMYNYD